MGKKSQNVLPAAHGTIRTETASSGAATNRSSILRSSFAPSSLQLHLFASVIQSFESQQIRIHDTNSGRLRHQHAARPGVKVCSLDWGHYGPSYRESQSQGSKKRKRPRDSSEDVVLAYGTSDSQICMYAPAEDRLVGTLAGSHENGVHDFKFVPDDYLEGWSVGGDAKLVQWDLRTDAAVRTIHLSDPSIHLLSRPSSLDPTIICGSTVPFTINIPPSGDVHVDSFAAFPNPIQLMLRSGHDSVGLSELFLAVDQDRYMNIFEIQQKKLIRTLVAGSGVRDADLYTPTEPGDARQQQMLAAVTQDGIVELFPRPFSQPAAINGHLKSQRKNMTRKSTAQIKLLQANTGKLELISAVLFRGPDLVLVSVDNGVEPSFQKVRWQDEGTGELLLEGTSEVHKIKSVSAVTSASMNGVKDLGKTHVDESRTVVVNGAHGASFPHDAIEISSGDEANGDEDDTDRDQKSEGVNEAAALGRRQASEEHSDHVMDDVRDLDDDDDDENNSESDAEMDATAQDVEGAAPSFGDMLAMKHPEMIAIGHVLADRKVAGDGVSPQQLSVPSGLSLGTVLTQALRTNDTNLLESCLHANDPGIIQNTIQRLDSALAAALLSKLAERLASRPGRYGHLISWVQWTCIAHGGAMAGQPDVAAKVRTLYNVLSQRSSSLEKLLLLKGKLDLLHAQLQFRKQLQSQRGMNQGNDEPGMIYIEGNDDNWSSDDDDDIDDVAGGPKKLGFKTRVPLNRNFASLVGDGLASDEEEGDEMPTLNGIGSAGEDDLDTEESDSEIDATGSRRKGLVDVEAEVVEDDDDRSSGDEDGDIGEDSDDSEAEDDADGDGDDDDEDDSSMADFINDGEISEVSEEEDLDIDEETPPKHPATKRSKYKH